MADHIEQFRFLAEQQLRVTNELPAGCGDRHDVAVPVEQPELAFFLQRLDAAGKRRLREIQRIGGLGEIEMPGERDGVPQFAKIHITCPHHGSSQNALDAKAGQAETRIKEAPEVLDRERMLLARRYRIVDAPPALGRPSGMTIETEAPAEGKRLL
nr:hypothetical protein [Novosphingobium sp. G106]